MIALLLTITAIFGIGEAELFSTRSDAKLFFKYQASIRVKKSKSKKVQKKKKKPSPLGQYSDHKRLFDHNIFLRSLFNRQIHHSKYGNLFERFNRASFIDLGSAIMHKKRAPTVQDIAKDRSIAPNLSHIVATDINDYQNKKEYFNRWIKLRRKVSFQVAEISLSITRAQQVSQLFKDCRIDKGSAKIFRTVDTGIDRGYTRSQLKHHLHAVLEATKHNDVLYFFNKFLLFKAKEGQRFSIVGSFDKKVFALAKTNYKKINWKKRRLKKGFKIRKKRLRIIPSKHLKGLKN